MSMSVIGVVAFLVMVGLMLVGMPIAAVMMLVGMVKGVAPEHKEAEAHN